MGVFPCCFLSACVHGCPPATGRNSRAPMRTRAQTYSHALTLPHPHPQDDEPRGGGGGGELEAPAGEVLYEGLLRRKKEDHGRFEDPYKMVCVCRLQGSVLRVRLTHNGEVFAPAHAAAAYIASARIHACVQTCFCCGCASSMMTNPLRSQVVGLEEQFDLGRDWRLMPRSDKPDRYVSLSVPVSRVISISVLFSFYLDRFFVPVFFVRAPTPTATLTPAHNTQDFRSTGFTLEATVPQWRHSRQKAKTKATPGSRRL